MREFAFVCVLSLFIRNESSADLRDRVREDGEGWGFGGASKRVSRRVRCNVHLYLIKQLMPFE